MSVTKSIIISQNIDVIYAIIKPYEALGRELECVYGEITKGAFSKNRR